MPVGHVTKYGYRRIRRPGTGKLVMEHVLVWEKRYGPVPPDKELHHVNGDKLDNRIENLRLVSRLQHKRLHGGCELRDGQWWKPCRRCGTFRLVPEGYYRKPDGGISPICRPCAIRLAVEYKRKRRLRNAERVTAGAAVGGGL